MKSQKFKQTEIGMIPEDWEVKKIGNLMKINECSIKNNYSEKIIEYIDTSSVDRGHLISTQILNLKDAPSRAKRIIKDGDILISTVRPNLKHYFFVKKSKKNLIGSTGFVVISSKTINPEFLYYFLTTEAYINFLSAIADSHTSTYPSFNPEVIENSEIIFPKNPLEQSAIASILSSLDAKIELNNKMNKTLEAIGQAIFKKWFVDEAKEEWKTGFLGDGNLTELIGSGIKKFEGERIYIATADIENANIINYKTNITFKNRPSRANMQLIPNSIWFAKMRESKKIFLIAPYNEFEIKNLIFSTGFAGLKVKPEALYYIWNIINNPSFEIIKDNLSIGTTMQGVNNELIQKITFNIPNKETLEKFNLKTSGIYHKICLNNQESQSLAQIRDALLPKLMSGEIRVPIK